MTQLAAVARKELRAYFGSPMAVIFLGTFLVAAFFSFFWIEGFFARNLADTRPLFRWFPVLLIFLVAALTMRQWSEEQKMGTLEILLTLPVRPTYLVLGKFMAVQGLVAIALLLTLGLPITVSMIGDLDWGPVAGGYMGAILLSGAYVAMGLFVSSKTDNQIIALISTVLLCSVFYLAGSSELTGLVGTRTAEIMASIGTGSRFYSIERGVLDLRDVIYYLSLTTLFLVLNVASLESKRWSTGRQTVRYRRNTVLGAVLVGLNLLALNLWLYPSSNFRVDLTEEGQYSISDTTRDLVRNLQEPLLIRGYFSSRTHPLLAPLVPTIRDTIQEYVVASGNRITAEFVDPREDEELEAEANQNYGIRPVPFQVAGRYEASIINSYFDILIKYGDQHVVLNFRDLIEIQPHGDTEIDVRLRNLEYDLTRSIKKVVYGFQSIDAILAQSTKPIRLIAFITPEALPPELAGMPDLIRKAVGQVFKEGSRNVKFEEVNPDVPGSPVSRKDLEEKYGFQPMARSLFSEDTFFLYLALEVGDRIEKIFPSPDMTESELREEIEAAVKRGASGFLKTVGLWAPPPEPAGGPVGMRGPVSTYRLVQEQLGQNYNVQLVDLSKGRISGDINVLALMAPQGLSETERFAIDQFLMRGGSVIAAAGTYGLDSASLQSGSLGVKEVRDGLDALLKHYGISIGKSLVMDLQNEPFPLPVVRRVGMFQVREIRQMDYPFFVDIRRDTMAPAHPIVANLPAITMQWASPLALDDEALKGKVVTILLRSSDRSWQVDGGINIQPDFERFPELGFSVPPEFERSIIAVAVKGSFSSFFGGKPVPVPVREGEDDSATTTSLSPLETSPDSARLVVIGSGEFLNDLVMNISRSSGQDRFLNSLDFLQNAVDWSVEDEDLLAIRSRGSHARLLAPTTRERQSLMEWLNYGGAFVFLVGITGIGALRRRRETPMNLDMGGTV